jgi:transposase-like protein
MPPSDLYPKKIEDFLDRFSTEKLCLDYLETLKWPEGFVCPQCMSKDAWRTDRGLWHCRDCQHQASVTAGTVFEDTRKPLRLWFHVMWLMMAHKTGLSAKGLCDAYEFGSYQTAWGWLHKLRSVMIRAGRERLQGRVEIDEAYVGGKREGSRGRGAEGKTLVIVAVEGVEGGKLGRVRFRCIPSITKKHAERFVTDYIEQGSVIVTDGWKSCNKLDKLGYEHEPFIQRTGGAEALEKLDHAHFVISLLKRWLSGTHHGAVKPEHLQAYLDEFAFRFNRRLSTHRGMLFYRLAQQAVLTRPPSIKEFYKKKEKQQDVGGT